MAAFLNPVFGDVALWRLALAALPVALFAGYLYRYVWSDMRATYRNLRGRVHWRHC